MVRRIQFRTTVFKHFSTEKKEHAKRWKRLTTTFLLRLIVSPRIIAHVKDRARLRIPFIAFARPNEKLRVACYTKWKPASATSAAFHSLKTQRSRLIHILFMGRATGAASLPISRESFSLSLSFCFILRGSFPRGKRGNIATGCNVSRQWRCCSVSRPF